LDRRPRRLGDLPDDPGDECNREQSGQRCQPVEELVTQPIAKSPGVAELRFAALWDRCRFHRAGAFQPRTEVVTSVTTPSHIIHILSTLADGTGRDTHTVSTMDSAKSNEAAGPAIGVASPPSAAGLSREVVFDIDDLAVSYGKALAVAGVTLDVHRNAITALIGPSGCGKSTVLRCLNRMNDLVPNARVDGKVVYHGTDLYGSGVDPIEVRRRIGMVFQRPNPFPKSIYDNVAYGLRILGMKDNLDDRVERALRGAALWEEVKTRLKRSAFSLSGGQQQRLCIARAIAVEPDVILLDEPASALDPISTSAIEDLMHDLKRDYTLVIVTHNMQQAARVAEMTAFFSLDVHDDGTRNGILVEYDSTEKIFTQPSDERTEGYVTGRFG
jgi:phosphate transport system ATP-binding protein